MTGPLTTIGQPDWLVHPSLQSLMAAFENNGHRIYAVGGCVRDTAMGRPVKDVDLSTDARPEVSTAIIADMGWKAVPTGIDHGTVTAVPPDGTPTYEITTFRTDVDTDGRHATVAFSRNIEDDAMRRDFTINAFYADRTGAVLDVVGGSEDLARRHIRFIGDPMDRIREDYLRILRFFRFTGSHGASDEGVDADGLSACAMLAEGLTGVSRERIGMEFTRIISGDTAAPTAGMMDHSGVLARILPGAGVTTLARLIDLEEAVPETGIRDMPTRLAALGCDDVADRLRLSKAEAAKIALVRHEAGTTTPAHELGYRHGYWPALHCLLLRWAGLLEPFDPKAQQDAAMGAEATFPVTAQDLMPAYEGKALGDRLKTLEADWIASRFAMSRSDLLQLP
ncbi:CCA tRNA nucleotidyltransferase [Pseudooctadecabacter sp.]|uniref:CCA tRNA nucleotidyltransferase n=1 Tax=Pseudooctadecabacter sp. TaxID=1966338 RepID=UPI0025E2B685|nr:CCA tRNA nucleotidyltransferase [Pseudooctadecabacter sp.]